MNNGDSSMASLINDLSFAGAKVLINGGEIKDFMDDASPVDVQDAETCNIEWSCNGKMIRTVKPSGVFISITVIPGSNSDNNLKRLWRERMCDGGSVSLGTADATISCSIITHLGSYKFSRGTCVAGAAAVSANGQGKMGGNTYTFAFEKV